MRSAVQKDGGTRFFGRRNVQAAFALRRLRRGPRSGSARSLRGEPPLRKTCPQRRFARGRVSAECRRPGAASRFRPFAGCVDFRSRTDRPEEARGGGGRSPRKRASAEWGGRGLAPPAGAGRRDGASGPRPCRSSAAEDRTGCCGGSSLRRKRSVRKSERSVQCRYREGRFTGLCRLWRNIGCGREGRFPDEWIAPPRPQRPAVRVFVRRFGTVSGGRLPHPVRRLMPCGRRKRAVPFRAGSVCCDLMDRRRFAAFLCCLRPCCAGDRGSVRVRCGYDAASSSLQIRVFRRYRTTVSFIFLINFYIFLRMICGLKKIMPMIRDF